MGVRGILILKDRLNLRGQLAERVGRKKNGLYPERGLIF